MPREKDGTVKRARYTSLKLGELSSVDKPAQPGALAVCFKRDDVLDPAVIAEVAKYVCETDGAHSFAEVLTENKFSQEIWPFTDALSQSIRSIVGDTSLTGADREGRINASVAEFLGAVRTISPEVGKQLGELISKRESLTMAKTVEQLEQEITALKGTHTASIEELTKRAETAEAALETAKADLVKATDEKITVGGRDLLKSEVGEANFSVAKALRDERDMAQFEKRADAEFGHVTGTTAEKAQMLKAIDGIADETAKTAALAVLAAAEKMAAAGFGRIGAGFGEPNDAEKAAESGYLAKVAEVRKADPNLSEVEAMSKARRDFPAEFAAYSGTAN